MAENPLRTPTRVVPLSPTHLRVEWEGMAPVSLPYFEVRCQCPCAACVDEKTGKRTLRREAIDPAIRLTGVEPVGRYALGLRWSDGHSTGMVHFDRLFDLCREFGAPCETGDANA